MSATKKVNIKYLKAYDFKTSLVTGVHGAIGANGLVNVNFFADRAAMPDSQVVEINEQNVIISTEDKKENEFVRDVHFGCYMDIHTARLVASWLDARIKEFETKFKTTTNV